MHRAGVTPLTPARWPNALLWTEGWWSRDAGWAAQANGSSCGESVDAGTLSPAAGEEGHQSLAGTGVSFNGCNAIINNGTPAPPPRHAP